MTIGTGYVIVGQSLSFVGTSIILLIHTTVKAATGATIPGATLYTEYDTLLFFIINGGKNMTLQQLHYAITISETGSLNKAAEVLYVAQPSLTGSMQELEKELGITIFHRSGRGVSLTNDGLEFITYARQVYHQYEILVDKYGRLGKRKKKFGVSAMNS